MGAQVVIVDDDLRSAELPRAARVRGLRRRRRGGRPGSGIEGRPRAMSRSTTAATSIPTLSSNGTTITPKPAVDDSLSSIRMRVIVVAAAITANNVQCNTG